MPEEAKVNEKSRLRDLFLLPEYNPDDNEIVTELYAPCLGVSKRYDRAVGFFRANIYREIGVDLLNFAIKGGKARLVCSPDLPEPDEEAARDGYNLRGKRPAQEQENSIIAAIDAMSGNPDEVECLEMLRLLIEKGSLDLFIATRPGGIFHRKIGLFADDTGDIVVFSGSGNETQMAISNEDWVNDEEFDVYRSWGDEFERKKVERKVDYLNRLLKGGTRRTTVRPLNEVEREVLSRFRKYSDLDECKLAVEKRSKRTTEPISTELRFYQEQAISEWEKAGYKGILSMATATGKTITALFAIKRFLVKGDPILILVPTEVLFNQWKEKIESFYPEIPILLAGAGNDWKSNQTKRMYVSNILLPRIILSTMHTATSDDFLEFIRQAENLVLVADEVHRLGSPNHRRIFNIKFGEMLGLSATPERLYDPEGSEALTRAFGEKPVYELKIGDSVQLKADDIKPTPILGHFLSNYTYDFDIAHLTAAEQEEWNDITTNIKREIAKEHSRKDQENKFPFSEDLKYLLIRRARIIKNAFNKVDSASRIIKHRYPENGRWIIYCEDESQMDRVIDRLRNENSNSIILKYHSKMAKNERERALSTFEANPGIIVSIRCLDEGIDIPSADGAIILASSTNPREYTQRRGRLLRKAKGKRIAEIYDVITLPTITEGEDQVPFSIIRSELARAYIFAQHAVNPEVTHRLWRICTDYAVNLDIDTQLSLQEDDWEE